MVLVLLGLGFPQMQTSGPCQALISMLADFGDVKSSACSREDLDAGTNVCASAMVRYMSLNDHTEV